MDETIINKIKFLAQSARKYFHFEKVILFGSYANGKFTDESDIDVAFVVNKILDNHFELSSKLFELVYDIDYRIEPLIISSENDRSGFLESILRDGYEIIYN